MIGSKQIVSLLLTLSCGFGYGCRQKLVDQCFVSHESIIIGDTTLPNYVRLNSGLPLSGLGQGESTLWELDVDNDGELDLMITRYYVATLGGYSSFSLAIRPLTDGMFLAVHQFEDVHFQYFYSDSASQHLSETWTNHFPYPTESDSSFEYLHNFTGLNLASEGLDAQGMEWVEWSPGVNNSWSISSSSSSIDNTIWGRTTRTSFIHDLIGMTPIGYVAFKKKNGCGNIFGWLMFRKVANDGTYLESYAYTDSKMEAVPE